MSLKEQLKNDMKEAMRAKEIVKRDTIRAINTMIKQIEVDERIELGDEEIVALMQKAIKQRNEAIEQYKNGGRDDLVAKEQGEIDVINLYMPKQLSDEELEAAMREIIATVGATSMKDMGKVMGAAKSKVGAGADGKRINEMVKKILG
ncbi:MAG: GatB/YqeY domain-containing protein [Campylobacterales bacterium]|nr:GatB/YqeY domain-containing protein [Campylobacterales bacterium]